jgi:2-dehydropantoate 2-reductase
MRIAVMATGAVGGYFGGRLAAAGHEVAFVARGANLAALRRDGLRIESPLGALHLPRPMATDDPAEIGPVDLVLFAVKLWDTEAAAEQARPLIGANTRLITFQNGVDAPEIIARALGPEAVVAGSAYIAAVLAAPGVVSHTSEFAKLVCGRIDGARDPAVEAFAAAAAAAGIDISLADDMNRLRWEKFVFLVGLSGATASMRMPIGAILADPDTSEFFEALMRETWEVGRASGVSLAPDFVDNRMAFAATVPSGMKASMAHDLDQGKRLELDWLSGRVSELGKELGVATPANDAVRVILKLHRMGRAGAA